MVVIVETGWTGGIREVHVITVMAKGKDLLDCIVRGTNFGFTGRAVCVFLTDGISGNGVSTAYDEEAAHRSIFEEFNFNSFFDGTANLATPVGVAETLERLVG